MKKIYIIIATIILTINTFAQSPEKMSYQAVIRDVSNTLVTTQTVGIQISILKDSVTGTSVYVETQTPTTNINGLVSLEVGNGTVVSGTFSAIDWSNGPYFIKTETDITGGTSYTISGTSQLLSVPYALHAKTAENITSNIIYSVGDYTQGGVVFYVTPNGKHGLVIEIQDQTTVSFRSKWVDADTLVSNPAYHSVNAKEFIDWRLPNKYEMTVINSNKSVIDSVSIANGGTAIRVDAAYWTSSINTKQGSSIQNSYIWAADLNFWVSTIGYNDVQSSEYIRAIRNF